MLTLGHPDSQCRRCRFVTSAQLCHLGLLEPRERRGLVESALAELRVAGGKRLGPARSRKLIKIIMATREQAFERL